MSCPNCGGTMIGDGVTMPIHCENAEAPNIEPDANPVLCRAMPLPSETIEEFERIVT